jgi:hypothetical protein
MTTPLHAGDSATDLGVARTVVNVRERRNHRDQSYHRQKNYAVLAGFRSAYCKPLYLMNAGLIPFHRLADGE